MRASIILGVGISACLVLSACGNFVLRTTTGSVAGSQNNVVFYNPTTKYKVTLNFAAYVSEEKRRDVDGLEYVAGRNYHIGLKPGSEGVVFAATKDYNKHQQFTFSLAPSEGAFTDVEKLEINLDGAGCLSSINSELTDKKKETAKSTVAFAFDVAKIASGIPLGSSSERTGPPLTMERKIDMDFSVSREFYEEDMTEVGGQCVIDLKDDIERSVGVAFSKVKAEDRPVDLGFKVVFQGERPEEIEMGSARVIELLNQRGVVTKPNEVGTGLLRQRQLTGSGSDSAFRTGAERPFSGSAMMEGVPYPLPRRVDVSIMRTVGDKAEPQATGRVMSVDGGGFEVLQIDSKSFVKRTMNVTFSSVNGLPTAVSFKSGSQAAGAAEALSAVSTDITTKLGELETAKNQENQKRSSEEIEKQKELLTKLKESEKNLIILEEKIDDLEERIEKETDEDKKKALKKELEDEERELKYARLERSLLISGLDN